VTIFFVLSGFLITNVIQRQRETGRWSFPAFMAARAARLVPALATCCLVVAAVWLAQGRPIGEIAEHLAPALLYFEDFVHYVHHDTVLSHTWSLAVEEQFYLLWPPLLGVLIAHRKTMLWAVAALIVASLACRTVLAGLGLYDVAYAALPTNVFGLLIGCLLAAGNARLPKVVPPAAATTVATVGLLGLSAAADRIPGTSVSVPAAAAVLTALLLLGLLPGNPLYSSRPARFLGRVSYAWYLWHWPLLWLTGTDDQPGPGFAVAAAALIVATGSTLFIEEPIRGWWRERALERSAVAA
jgi:peptidoglycan/LPS O-acetylase OafA/YrhL